MSGISETNRHILTISVSRTVDVRVMTIFGLVLDVLVMSQEHLPFEYSQQC